jgi:hypothetical protein
LDGLNIWLPTIPSPVKMETSDIEDMGLSKHKAEKWKAEQGDDLPVSNVGQRKGGQSRLMTSRCLNVG